MSGAVPLLPLYACMLWPGKNFIFLEHSLPVQQRCAGYKTNLISGLITYFATYLHHGEESFLRTNRFSYSQEIPRILWNPKVHYRIHKCPPPVPILSHIDAVHVLTSHFLKIHLNILPYTPGSSKWPLFFNFPYQSPIHTSALPHSCYMPRLPHSYRFDHPNNIGWHTFS